MAIRDELFMGWFEDIEATISALVSFRQALERWRSQRCDAGEFHTVLFSLRSAGLEGWADGLDIDGLFSEVVNVVE
jgi:hypothetical protein